MAGPHLLRRPAAAPLAPQGEWGRGHLGSPWRHSTPAPSRAMQEAVMSRGWAGCQAPHGWSSGREVLWWEGCKVGAGAHGGCRNCQRPVSSAPLPELIGPRGQGCPEPSGAAHSLSSVPFLLAGPNQKPPECRVAGRECQQKVPGTHWKQWPCAETGKQVAGVASAPGYWAWGSAQCLACSDPDSPPPQPDRHILQQQVWGLCPHPSPHADTELPAH